jgi:uncharacterized RDD family membrane protein YckC
MERGSPPPDRPDPERPRGPETPGGRETPPGPETPSGPQAPAPGPQAPPPPPQGPPGYAPSPESPPGYGGPVPPGGWQQPVARPAGGWVGQPLASWGSRLGAYIIDGLILLIPIAVLGVVIFGGTVDEDSSAGAWIGASILYALLIAAVVLLYAPLLMMRQGERNGQTLGKQALGIRVVRDNGQPMGFGRAALREVVLKQLAVNIASSIIPLIPWFLNYFWPLWDDQNRALHDMAASTHVIRA